MPCNQAGNISSERGREPAEKPGPRIGEPWMAALHDKPHTQGANKHSPQCLACQNYAASSAAHCVPLELANGSVAEVKSRKAS